MVGSKTSTSSAGEDTPLVPEVDGGDIEQGALPTFEDEPLEASADQLKPIKEGSARELLVGVFGAITCKSDKNHIGSIANAVIVLQMYRYLIFTVFLSLKLCSHCICTGNVDQWWSLRLYFGPLWDWILPLCGISTNKDYSDDSHEGNEHIVRLWSSPPCSASRQMRQKL
jgi:hypothetical protein